MPTSIRRREIPPAETAPDLSLSESVISVREPRTAGRSPKSSEVSSITPKVKTSTLLSGIEETANSPAASAGRYMRSRMRSANNAHSVHVVHYDKRKASIFLVPRTGASTGFIRVSSGFGGNADGVVYKNEVEFRLLFLTLVGAECDQLCRTHRMGMGLFHCKSDRGHSASLRKAPCRQFE